MGEVERKVKRKVGDCYSPYRGELGPHLTQCRLGRGLSAYPVVSYPDSFSRLATIDMDRASIVLPETAKVEQSILESQRNWQSHTL